MAFKKTHFTCKDTNKLKMKGQKKQFHANENQNAADVAMLISDNIDFVFFFF